jgi:hypothetical protein
MFRNDSFIDARRFNLKSILKLIGLTLANSNDLAELGIERRDTTQSATTFNKMQRQNQEDNTPYRLPSAPRWCHCTLELIQQAILLLTELPSVA